MAHYTIKFKRMIVSQRISILNILRDKEFKVDNCVANDYKLPEILNCSKISTRFSKVMFFGLKKCTFL